MSLLLRPPSRDKQVQDVTSTSYFGLAPLPLTVYPSPTRAVEEREKVRTALFERKYRQIMEARLGHLPLRLPFPKVEVANRLRENDRSAPNWRSQQELLEIETDLAFLNKSLATPSYPSKSKQTPKARRLKAIWDYLSLTARRSESILLQRAGRLNYNVGLFYRSDLPPSYLVDIAESTHWEMAAFSITTNSEAESLVHQISEQGVDQTSKADFLKSGASLRDIDKAFREYLRRVRKVTTISDLVLEWRDALEYYVDLFSADSLAMFRVPRTISVSSLDQRVLGYLSTGLRGAVQELRSLQASEYADQLRAYDWVPGNTQLLKEFLLCEIEAT